MNGHTTLSVEGLGLSELINAFSTAIFVKDRRHRFVMVNDSCARIVGRTPQAMIGRTNDEHLPRALADRLRDMEEQVFLTGEEKIVEEQLKDRKGVVKTYSTTRTLFSDRSGRQWLIGVMNDITVHKRVLDEARFTASLLEAENEASIAGILIVDESEKILSANRRFREMWGIPDEVFAARSDAKALKAVVDKLVDPETFQRRVRHLYRHREEKSHEEVLLRDGRIFDRYTAPVVGPEGVYFGRVWHFRDITEMRKLEALKSEVRHRRELDELKDRFIGTVSHELRTPLTIVRSAIESLCEGVGGALTPPQQEIADLCARNVVRLSKMINNLLHISRLESGKASARIERLDLAPLLSEMEANFRMVGRGGGRNISISIDAPAGLPPVAGDPELIGEVLYNLLDNAARFARSAVRVKVRRRRGRVDGRDAELLRVEVLDDGPGIPRDQIGLLFNKFTQVERCVGGGYKGTGLGLAICKEIMTLHGTGIGVESEPGKGTCFYFFLQEYAKRPAPPAGRRLAVGDAPRAARNGRIKSGGASGIRTRE
jgi:PAS domain S-box-containing protein